MGSSDHHDFSVPIIFPTLGSSSHLQRSINASNNVHMGDYIATLSHHLWSVSSTEMKLLGAFFSTALLLKPQSGIREQDRRKSSGI